MENDQEGSQNKAESKAKGSDASPASIEREERKLKGRSRKTTKSCFKYPKMKNDSKDEEKAVQCNHGSNSPDHNRA